MKISPSSPLSDDENTTQELLNKVFQTVKEQPHKVNEVNEDGYTLLQQALINNAHIEDKISQLDNINGAERDALNNSLVAVKILLNNRADPNIPFPGDDSQNAQNPQHFLVKATQSQTHILFPLHIISILFEHDLDVQAGDSAGNTALLRLISLLHVWKKIPAYREGFIKLAVRYANNFDTQNNEGNTALHLASRFNDLETARLILQNPVRLDIRNSQGRTPKQTAQLMSSAILPETIDLRWYWYFSFSSANYKMIRLLETAERELQPAKRASLQKETLIHDSSKTDAEENSNASRCGKLFSSAKASK